ncbi:MAG: hypothetical protein WCJ02_10970 [bacterium]
MPKSKYNTNLAAEFYILAALYRKGLNAYLTLGNKKAVDIVIDFGTYTTTIDVKGIEGTTLWPMDNFSGMKPHHFIVFVSFLKKIDNPSVLPEVYIVPSGDIAQLLYHNPKGNRQGIRRSTIRTFSKNYQDRWDLIS